MNGEMGLHHLYYGDGKGKTTAAAGLAIRAAGNGKKVIFAQFMKGGESGELGILRELPGVRVIRCTRQFPFYKDMSDQDKAEITSCHNEILEQIRDIAGAGGCDVVILDEITYPYAWNLIDRRSVKEMLSGGVPGPEIICTGRNPDALFFDTADYITNMACEKHPYESGAAARAGIEF